ncbi:ABC transporter permease [Propylenella binzhouense]|nr:ABC transporter permease [Propylenella binzhouense]
MKFSEISRNATSELRATAERWRMIHLMGSAELRRRYARSRLGQFWLTLSTAVFVLALGTFWAQVVKLPLETMIPHLAIGQILWTFLSTSVLESTSAFQSYSWVLQNQYTPNGVVISSVVYRNILSFIYNSTVIVAIIAFFGLFSMSGVLTFLLLFLLTCVFLSASCFIVAIICVRFRDVIQIVATLMTALFFFTPIFWKQQLLPAELQWIVRINPFAIVIQVLRAPLMGQPITAADLAAFLALVLLSAAAAFLLVGRLRHRIIFWV